MKKVTQSLLALLFAALPVTGFAAAADVLFSQKNSSNTAWANVIVAPTPSSALAFNSSKVPISTQALTLLSVTSPAGNDLTLAAGGTNQSVVLTPSGTGGVGIGTVTPAAKLEIAGTYADESSERTPATVEKLSVIVGGGGDGATYFKTGWSNSANSGIFTVGVGYFSSGSQVRDVITLRGSTGDVSISSSTAGSAGAGALVLQGGISAGNTGSAASYFGGAVSIAADATIYGLTVGRGAGAVSTNTAVGANAISGSNTGGNNTAVGWETLKVNTSGVQNVAIGRSALAANNTGSGNNAMGVGALSANQSGSNNIAIGGDALVANLSASENTAVGYRALYSNTTGGQNTALGDNALSSNTTASYNTALGRYAAHLNTTGTGLTAVGHQALASNTTGTANIAMGGYDSTSGNYAALYENTTGSFNVGIGVAALRSNTTASNNTAVGYQAGYTNQTGSGNTFLGYTAGNASTGSHNTLLGRASGLALTTGVSNTFIGGYAASTGGSGAEITSGSKNTIIGAYNGNQGGLDIRTASNYIVLSDGDGNPRAYFNGAAATFAGAVTMSAYGAGAATFDSSGNITSVSDARLKNITGTFTKGLAEIVKLTPKLYTWKPETGLVTDDINATLIAQDLIAAGLSEAVATYRTVPVMEDGVQSAEDIAAGKPVTQHAKLDANGKAVTKRVDANYSVSDRTVIAALVNAVKELKAEIDALKAAK
jgi:hypothetical protein